VPSNNEPHFFDLVDFVDICYHQFFVSAVKELIENFIIFVEAIYFSFHSELLLSLYFVILDCVFL